MAFENKTKDKNLSSDERKKKRKMVVVTSLRLAPFADILMNFTVYMDSNRQQKPVLPWISM